MTQKTIEKTQAKAAFRLLLPNAPILVPAGRNFYCLTPDGEFLTLSNIEAKNLISQQMPIICNGAHIAGRLGVECVHSYDVLELFAFVHPAKFATPSPKGLAKVLDLFAPSSAEDECSTLLDIAKHLLLDLHNRSADEEKSNPAAIAALMGLYNNENRSSNSQGWAWADSVLAALGRLDNLPDKKEMRIARRIWEKLETYPINAPHPPASHHAISAEEVNENLEKILRKQKRKSRAEQVQYAEFLSKTFTPLQDAEKPNVLLAEAGTGVGKTIGYLSPATLWAEKNEASVWISTYTRNLQRQIDKELGNFYNSDAEKKSRVVTRKGRENYLCLLNLEDISLAPSINNNAKNAAALGLMLRWVAATEDGDFAGKDFPGWLAGLIGYKHMLSFIDRRGECVYSACPHFDKCFVEKSIRRTKNADIVIANHALVMNHVAVNSNAEIGELPSHYIFDEGHHMFESADSAYDLNLNGKETEDLRRWILGVESSRRSRSRGLKKRIEDLISDNDEALTQIEMIRDAAHSLPGQGWRQRLSENNPKGIAEIFLHSCYRQVKARNRNDDSFYSIECGREEPLDDFLKSSYALKLKLKELKEPISKLIKILNKKLIDEADDLNSDSRERISFIINSLTFRAENLIAGWISMLDSLQLQADENCVDWLEITRIEGRESDVGIYRRYIDPIKVFNQHLKPHLQGMAITSATLRDNKEWDYAIKRNGIEGTFEADMFSISSPFNYAEQTKVFVVTDIDKNNQEQIASAYRELFLASGGGALGIFTSIQRLKATHANIIEKLEDNNLRLYAQHIDPIDIASLIDIFKDEENACLLGTDATRDGIDVPGKALRLVVYDRVPWPKPTLLHKARRNYFGKDYDDMLTRFKIKQAYGRLIRQQEDKGIFVMLDKAIPTRLLSAFPEGVIIERLGLKDVIELTKEFLKD